MQDISIPKNLSDALCQANAVCVLTGAGVSAESGVPTFRDAQTGLWAQYSSMELATPEAFQRNPKLVWDWYLWRRGLVQKAKPNPAHLALADMEAHIPHFTLVTQNVDGLHHQAGSGKFGSLVELHGNIMRTCCSREKHVVDQPVSSSQPLPTCPDCGALLRPDVVWFGEALSVDALQTAQRAARECELFFSIGTSSVVEPAASLPHLARQADAFLVEINPNPTPLTAFVHFSLRGFAGKILPTLFRQTWKPAVKDQSV